MSPRFGSVHTKLKLDKLEEYLRIYTTALKKQNFKLLYFDAFAGAGDVQIASNDASLLETVDDYTPFIKGSAQRALRFDKYFEKYIFVDRNIQNVKALQHLKLEHPEIANRVDIRQGDANTELVKFCKDTDWNSARAVVFLDPYGNQVEWNTLVAIAATKAIDLWYLFPAGLGVFRQISKRGDVHTSHEASLDKIFGTRAWRDVFVDSSIEPDLFGSREKLEKRATVESITRFMADRMKGIFQGGVLDEWYPLGSRHIHMYSLMFAWANPSEKARLARTLALSVLKGRSDGRA